MRVLSTHNLHKKYGRITAVNQLNLDIEEGAVFGLLGPNGSGKTTTLGMILGVINPTDGGFQWFEEKAIKNHRKRIGSILEKPNFYPSFSAFKNLQIACKIKGVNEARIDEVLEQVGLLDRKNGPFKTYSLGMKQRLAIGSALLAHPEVLILDEPTNGLDPNGIAEIRALITKIAKSGKTIILASHLLDEVQKICSEFAILKNGTLIHKGAVDADLSDVLSIRMSADNIEELEVFVQKHANYLSYQKVGNGLEVKFLKGTNVSDVNKYLSEHGIYVNNLDVLKQNLEQRFLEILSKND